MRMVSDDDDYARHYKGKARTQCQDNVTEWIIMSWYWQPGLPVGEHYKVTTNCIVTPPDIILDINMLLWTNISNCHNVGSEIKN